MKDKDIKVLICTPSHDGKVQVGFNFGCMDLLRNGKEGYHYDFFFTEYASDIMKARNEMLWYFYNSTQHDYMLFIDADEGFNAQTIHELLYHAEEFEISGVPVPMKRINAGRIVEWVGAELQDEDKERIDINDMLPSTYEYNHSSDSFNIPSDRFIYVEKLGTGFMLIPRNVIEFMVQFYDTNESEFTPPIYRDKNTGENVYSFFSHLVHREKMLGEDYSFCIRAKESGVPLKVDTSLSSDHYGVYKWRGNVNAKKRHQKTRRKLVEKYTSK